jgi:hypothetical protein
MVLIDGGAGIPSEGAHARFRAPRARRARRRRPRGGRSDAVLGGRFRESADDEGIDADECDLEAVPSGSDDVALSPNGVPFPGGAATRVIAVGTLGDGSLDAILAEDIRAEMPADD